MSWLLENSLVAGIAACFVLAVCRLCKPRPAFAHVLWVLVLVKLLCPPVLRLPLPMDAPDLLGGSAATTVTSPLVHTAIPRPPADGGVIPLAVAPNSGPMHGRSPGATSPFAAGAKTDGTWSTWNWLALVWILGSVGVLASMLIGISRVQRIQHGGSRAPAWLRRELELLARRLRIDAPRVVVSSRIGSAFVWGLGRPTLMWPATGLDDGDRQMARSVLAHELAHIKRRDHWTAWLEIAATACLWWHPLMWLARSRLRLQAELACDAWAVWAVPQGRQAYAGALIDAVANESQAVTTVPVLAARPSARAFEKRLLMILNEDVPRRLSRWAAVPVAALSLTVFSGFSFAQERGGKKERRREATSKREIQKEVLRTVNQHLRKSLGRKYQVESLDDIDRVVQKFVSEQQGKKKVHKSKTDERVIIRHVDNVKDLRRAIESGRRTLRSGKKGKKSRHGDGAKHKVRVFVHGDGDVDRVIDLHDLLDGTRKHGHKNVKIEVLDLKGLNQLDLGADIKVILRGLGDDGKFEIRHGEGKNLGYVIRKALNNSLENVEFEVHDAVNIHELGLGDDVEVLVRGALRDVDLGKGIEGIVHKALKSGLRDAKIEIHADADLKRLGLTGNIEVLLDGILGGKGKGDSHGDLRTIILKSLNHTEDEVETDSSDGADEIKRLRRALRREIDRSDRKKKTKRKLERKSVKGRSKIF